MFMIKLSENCRLFLDHIDFSIFLAKLFFPWYVATYQIKLKNKIYIFNFQIKMNFGYINKRKALILSHHGAQM